MVKVDLKGIAKVTAKGHTYWYAWRGGPRLRGKPGTPEFIASYNETIEQRHSSLRENKAEKVQVRTLCGPDRIGLRNSRPTRWNICCSLARGEN